MMPSQLSLPFSLPRARVAPRPTVADRSLRRGMSDSRALNRERGINLPPEGYDATLAYPGSKGRVVVRSLRAPRGSVRNLLLERKDAGLKEQRILNR